LNFKAAPTETLPGRGSQVTRAPGGAEAVEFQCWLDCHKQ